MGIHLSKDQSFVQKLTDILETQLENDQFGVKELADEMGMSRSQLHRKVHSILRKSTSAFIREYRLQVAFDLLKADVATVSEIAYKVGFASPTYFNTCFNNQYGYPPGEAKFKGNLPSTSPIVDENTPAPLVSGGRKLSWIAIIGIIILVMSLFTFGVFSGSALLGMNENAQLIPRKNSIAVIPFENWSRNPQLKFLSDGITDAIISQLSKIDSIPKVVPYISVVRFQHTELGVSEISKILQVALLVQGNIQSSGDELKINVQLIDGSSEEILWSREYLRKWEENKTFNIQQRIAQHVVESVQYKIRQSNMLINTPKSSSKIGKLPF